MPGRVDGKVAFITGAARGQGRSHAVRLAEEGADIIAVDICEGISSMPYPLATPEDLEETVQLVEAHDRRIIAKQADVRDRDAIRSILDEAVEEFGHLDVVIPTAGVANYAGFEEITEEEWHDTIEINLTGVWHTCAVSLPHLKANGGGSIITTSSGVAVRAVPNLAHYAATKHGVIGLTQSLAKEFAADNIRANALCLTYTDTPMVMHEVTYRLFRPDLQNPTREDIVEPATALNMMPVPWIETIDVSNGVLFLASDESRYVTGTELRIDAGYGAN